MEKPSTYVRAKRMLTRLFSYWGLWPLVTLVERGSGPIYSDSLKGAKVVILPDNDPPGQEHARRVAKSLLFTGNATSIKVLDLPGLPEKGDLFDWIKLG